MNPYTWTLGMLAPDLAWGFIRRKYPKQTDGGGDRWLLFAVLVIGLIGLT